MYKEQRQAQRYADSQVSDNTAEAGPDLVVTPDLVETIQGQMWAIARYVYFMDDAGEGGRRSRQSSCNQTAGYSEHQTLRRLTALPACGFFLAV